MRWENTSNTKRGSERAYGENLGEVCTFLKEIL
jgi:hypothetical protein